MDNFFFVLVLNLFPLREIPFGCFFGKYFINNDRIGVKPI